jgi:hypothetical protein
MLVGPVLVTVSWPRTAKICAEPSIDDADATAQPEMARHPTIVYLARISGYFDSHVLNTFPPMDWFAFRTQTLAEAYHVSTWIVARRPNLRDPSLVSKIIACRYLAIQTAFKRNNFRIGLSGCLQEIPKLRKTLPTAPCWSAAQLY